MSEVKLADFVQQTIAEIVRGVVEAQKDVAEMGGVVNPACRDMSEDSATSRRSLIEAGGSGALVESIDFDVAVTGTKGEKTAGGIGIVVGPLALGSQGASTSGTETVSRLRFSVPVKLPRPEGS